MSTVLYIGSTDTSWSIVEKILVEHNYRVHKAEKLEEGLHLFLRVRPDIILAEVHAQPVNGYQIARFFRSQPELSHIPLVLLCSESDPKTEFWSKQSGADGIVSLYPEEVETLPGKIDSLLASSDKGEARALSESQREQLSSAEEKNIFSRLFDINEDHLFRLTMNNSLHKAAGKIETLEETAKEILNVLQSVAETHIAVIIIKYRREARIFVLPSKEIFLEDAEQFTSLCLDDFNRIPGAEVIRNTQKTYLNIEGREDFNRTRLDGRRLSSYHMAVLSGTKKSSLEEEDLPEVGEEHPLIGTLHAGNLTNNYFTGKLGSIFDSFADAASVVIRNSVLYNETFEMRNKIEHIFSKFVPREVIKDLLDQTEEAELQLGEKRHVAIIFSDIRSFTVISEHNSADMIVDFLNRYFDRMSQAIRKHGGFIDKFIGDAILAVFGAPVSYENNAERAVRASLDMKEALNEIETGDLVLPDSGFNIGIGVHEGQAIVGNLGSRDKFDYTVIGDNVNLASRLEGLTKHYHEQIIVSDVLAASLNDEFILREVDTVKVKGKEKPTTLYAVRSEAFFDEENLRNYTKGLSMFKLGNWITGKEYFEKILKEYPDDFLCSLYRDRCVEFASDPPADWDGAIKLDFK